MYPSSKKSTIAWCSSRVILVNSNIIVQSSKTDGMLSGRNISAHTVAYETCGYLLTGQWIGGIFLQKF